MEYGFVCFSYSKNEWIAKAIAWFTKSQWSHSFITVPNILGHEMAMEAAGKGVSMVLFDLAYRNNPNQAYEIYRFNITQDYKDYAILESMDLLETSYGLLEYPWFIWRYLNKAVGRDIKSYNNWSNKGTVCSELVRLYAQAAGYGHLFDGLGIASASAQDVYEIVLSHPELFELIEKKN